MSPLRLRRSSATVKLLFNVNHSRSRFLGSSTRDFERWLNGALEVKRLSLSLSLSLYIYIYIYGSSVKGTWSEGSVTGDPGGLVEKALEMDISFHRGPAGVPGRGLMYQGL